MKTYSSLLLFSALVFVPMACGQNTSTTTSGNPVFARDFEGYETWESFVISTGDGTPRDGGAVEAPDGGSFLHTSGARTVYLSSRPPKGSTEFPVGTIIVKVGELNTFAMHKRGGTYNAKGAHGWEWVELGKTNSGKNVIVWQGLGPPAGEKYGDIDVTCNDCHSIATGNDSVLDGPIQLTGF